MSQPIAPIQNVAPNQCELVFPGLDTYTRHALDAVKTKLSRAGVAKADRERTEIILAEAINNIIEHAYGAEAAGQIQVRMDVTHDNITLTLTDSGCPMPGKGLPKKQEADLNCARSDLPEGGFGWLLIHQLSDKVTYVRHGSDNITTILLRRQNR